MVENQFIDSFRTFIQECRVPFTEQGYIFLFMDHKLEIRLIAREGNSCMQQEIKFSDTLYLYEDRWFATPQIIRDRIAARLGRFRSIFARKCKIISSREWQQLEKEHSGKIIPEVEFLNKYHAYGYAASKYRYALLWENQIVAVATFSAPRPMVRLLSTPLQNVPKQQLDSLRILEGELLFQKEYQSNDAAIFCSYEWVRYASLPGARVVGGMGRLLKAFLKEVEYPNNPKFTGLPIEIMSYSDNEWSRGEVYQTLRFSLAGVREGVDYYVDKMTYERLSARKLIQKRTAALKLPFPFLENYYKITNQGSRKYLLQPLFLSR